MRIAVIGAGNVGGTLGTGRARRGHEIFFGARDTADPKLEELLARVCGNVHAAGVNEAAASAEVVALTVPWPAAQDALRSEGDLGGKILLDCTNPLKPDLSGLAVGSCACGRRFIFTSTRCA